VTEIEDIVRSARKGDRDAFRRLLERYHSDLYRLAFATLGNHHDAEDALQEAYISAYKGLARFRGDSDPKTWFYRITLNRSLDLRRKRRGVVVSLTPEHPEQAALDPVDANPDADPGRRLESKQMRALVAASLDRLSPLEHSVFVLRHHRELALKEIAAILERSEGTIKNILFRAVRKVRGFLRDHDARLEEVGE